MSLNPETSGAYTTLDGKVTGVSSFHQTHPEFGTPAREIRVAIPLRNTESVLAEAIHDHDIGTIVIALRSTVGQLGVEAFRDSSTELMIRDSFLVAETLITPWSEHGQQTIEEILRISQTDSGASIAHAAILPSASRIRRREMQLRQEISYAIDFDTLVARGELEAIVTGKPGVGRSIFQERRRKTGPVHELAPGAFLLGQFDVDERLERVIVINPDSHRAATPDVPTGIIHGTARIFHAHRDEPQRRQAEVRNCNGGTEKLEGLIFTAEEYAPALQNGE